MSAEPLDYTLVAGFLRGLRPDPVLSVSEWADNYRILPPTVAEPGPFRTNRTPYLREIMDKLSSTNPAQVVVFKKCSQIGATESGNNWLGYIIDVAPGVLLYVMPTDAMMKKTSKTRIAPMIKESDRLSAKIKPARSRDSGNTILEKEFEGGAVTMVGANSPVGLASTPVRFVYLDECDRYPLDVGGEGDVISLATTRTATYGERKKIFITSTPTLEGASIIDREFEKTGQRYFMVPCPHCATMIDLKFEQLRWEGNNYKDVYYQCQDCGEKITERHKKRMLENGEWQASVPAAEDGVTFGYHLNALYSPVGWYSWSQMAKEHDEAQKDLPKLITFTNTKLGEVFRAQGDSPEWQNIYNRREQYITNKPSNNVVFLTAGVDVQKDRLELEIVGWCKGKENFSIDYRVLLGNTETSDAPVWKQLSAVLDETFIREDQSQMQIAMMAVDSGYNTSVVYEFARKHVGKVIPTKGQDSQILMVSAPRAVDTSRSGKKIGAVKVWNIGVSVIKSEVYGHLRLQQNEDGTYPAGYCHFPQYDQHYFKGITAEKFTKTTNKKGHTVYAWIKSFERNEPLDCRVYARAAANVVGMDRFTDQQWDRLYDDTMLLVAKKPDAPKNKDTTKPKKKSSFWQ